MSTKAAATIKLITFDLDDTLWDIWPVIARAEARMHEWLVEYFPRIPKAYEPVDLRALCGEIALQQPGVAHDRTALRKLGLALAAERVGYRDFCSDSAFEIFYAARNEVVLFEEVLPALERLHQRYQLAALSNGNADIERIGLGHLFDFCLNPLDVGAPKPEPLMFREACRRARVEPHQVVHVGDDPDHDVRGAAVVGIGTVWVNRGAKVWIGEPSPDAEVATLEELETVLSRWDR